MSDGPARLHVIKERDVGLFSLVQQVIAHIPWALAEDRVPVVQFGSGTCYWTPNGYQDKDSVWEYYFEPLDPSYPAARIPEPIQALLEEARPSAQQVGYEVRYGAGNNAFVSSHFGDHPQLKGKTLPIPYAWDDPSEALRKEAKAVLDDFVRPRTYITQRVRDFFARHMAGHYVIGVHARGTDATSEQEIRAFRHGSLVLPRYCAEIEWLLESQPRAKIFVATDEQSSLRNLAAAFPDRVISYDSVRHESGEAAGKGPTGWLMPAYIAGDRDVAAQNGEDAVIESLLLSRCDHLVHNGSSLARTVLLHAPELPHTNTHTRQPEMATALVPGSRAAGEGRMAEGS